MSIHFLNQIKKFKCLLDQLKSLSVAEYNKCDLREKITTVQIDTKLGLHQLNLDLFLDYHVFPSHILSAYPAWRETNRNMQKGDTVLQQVYFPPLNFMSIKMIFGVRINEVIREELRIGYSYETLDGHVEKGVSTFTVEQKDNGLIFKIHTFSQPGNVFLKCIGPFFTIPYQSYCTRQALKNVKKLLELHETFIENHI